MNAIKSIPSKLLDYKAIGQLIYYATKAPSGHNSQPWKFRAFKTAIEIVPDFSRELPVVDPEHRELYISLGCAVENLCVAAWQFGFEPKWKIVENEDGTHKIRVEMNEPEVRYDSPLFRHMEKRQSNRNVYDSRLISQKNIEELKAIPSEKGIHAYFFKKDTNSFATIRSYIMKGNAIQMKDKAFKKELMGWIRFNGAEVNSSQDGLTYKVMASPAMPRFLGKMIVGSFLNPKKQNKTDAEKIDSSSDLVLLTTENNSVEEWISLGVYLERLLLNLTEKEIASAFVNPPCELPELAAELKSILPINNENPTIILRLGFAEMTAFSPRRDLSEAMH